MTAIEHEHAVRDLHDELHVVLDQRDRGALARDLLDQPVDLLGLHGIAACGRLVKEQKLGLAGEGARNLQTL